MSYPWKTFRNIQRPGQKHEKLPRRVAFFFSPVLQGQRQSWECPGARPRPEPDRRALSSGCPSFCRPRPEARCRHCSHREESSVKSTARAAPQSYSPNAKNVSLFKTASIKAIPGLCQRRTQNPCRNPPNEEGERMANGYPDSHGLASITRARPAYTHRERPSFGHVLPALKVE